jgi:hypothetical protein
MKKKVALPIALLTLLLFYTLAGIVHFGAASSTNISGIIYSDTTWTKANSPYTLTGPVGVGSGVTLTIEPGVTVNLGEYYLQVSGTLYARGSSLNNIIFVSTTPLYGNIAFTDGSNSWNEQTGSGSIIENAILYSTSISSNIASPKINNNTINGAINIDGCSTIISNNIISGDIGVHSSSPKIENNSINGGINVGNSLSGSLNATTISNNIIHSGGAGNGVGIELESSYTVYVSGNIIYGCPTGVLAHRTGLGAIIEDNLIINNNQGIYLSSYSLLKIRNNTIANNGIGINLEFAGLTTIVYNNIQNNSQNSIYLRRGSFNVNATYNWWGTTNSQLINLTIYDSKNDFNLETVNFTPFLTEPNPNAPAIPSPTSTPTPSPTDSPTPTATVAPSQSPSQSPSPSQNPTESPTPPQTGLNGIEIAILAVLIVIAALLAGILAVLFRIKR